MGGRFSSVQKPACSSTAAPAEDVFTEESLSEESCQSHPDRKAPEGDVYRLPPEPPVCSLPKKLPQQGFAARIHAEPDLKAEEKVCSEERQALIEQVAEQYRCLGLDRAEWAQWESIGTNMWGNRMPERLVEKSVFRPHVRELIERAPERMQELFELFTLEELGQLLSDRIRSVEDLDAVVAGYDVILRLKELHEKHGYNSVWIAYLADFLPENIFLTEFKQEFLHLLDRWEAMLVRGDVQQNDDRSDFLKPIDYYRGRHPGDDAGGPTDDDVRKNAAFFFKVFDTIASPEDLKALAGIAFGLGFDHDAFCGVVAGSGLIPPGDRAPVAKDAAREATRLLNDAFLTNGFDSLPPHVAALLAASPDKIVELFRAFGKDDAFALLIPPGGHSTSSAFYYQGRIQSEEDLDALLHARDFLLKARWTYWSGTTRAGLRARKENATDWNLVLSKLPANEILVTYRQELLDLVAKLGASLFFYKNEQEFSSSRAFFMLRATPATKDELVRRGEIFFELAGLTASPNRIDDIAALLFDDRSPVCPLPAVEHALGMARERLQATWAKGIPLSTLAPLFIKHHDILAFPDALDRILAKAIGKAEKDVRADELFLASRLDNLLSALALKHVQFSPDAILTVLDRHSLGDAIEILSEMAKAPCCRLLNLYAASATKDNARFAALIGYLEKVECSEGRFKRLMRQWPDLDLDDLALDERTGRDIRDLSIDDADLYRELFGALRTTGLTELETKLVDGIRIDRFGESLRGMNILDRQIHIGEIANAIHPKLAETLSTRFIGDELANPGAVSGILKLWFNPTSGMIDVTQHNLALVDALLGLLISSRERGQLPDMNRELKAVFPGYADQAEAWDGVVWLANALDVEEINTGGLKGFDALSLYLKLQQTMEILRNLPASRYMNNRFADMDLTKILGLAASTKQILDTGAIEAMRRDINRRQRNAGDQIIHHLGGAFLETHPASIETLPELLDFARAWGLGDTFASSRDVEGLYEQASNWAFDMIARFLKEELKTDENALHQKLAVKGIDLEKLVTDLESRGFSILKQGNLSKILTRNPVYTARKIAGKIVGVTSFNVQTATVQDNEAWSRKGVKVQSVMVANQQIATVIRCQRGATKVEILAEQSGIVRTETVRNRLGRRYIFSAPMSMTTGDRKLTEIAFKDGVQMNYLGTPTGKDGLLVVGPDGDPRVLDKRKIRIAEILSDKDLDDPAIKQVLAAWMKQKKLSSDDAGNLLRQSLEPFANFTDNKLFTAILKLKRMSLLCGMLLVEDGKPQHLGKDDGADSRRFYVEFKDGSFGIVNASVNMTTDTMIDIAHTLGATKAIYMDTGMYDMADYVDGTGEQHVIGHRDTDDSTNRVVIYSAE